MSALSDKILTYSPEVLLPFDYAYSVTPGNLGSSGATTTNFILSNETPSLNVSGGIDSQGSWIFPVGTGVGDTTPTRYRMASNSVNWTSTELTDNDWSMGIWFKINGTLLNTTSHATAAATVVSLQGPATRAFVSIIGGGANNANKGKLQVVFPSPATNFVTANRYDDNEWHYFAAIATFDSGTSTATIQCFIDGQSVATRTVVPTVTTATSEITFGINATNPNPYEITSFEIQNFYIAPASSIESAAIAEIWTTGTTGGGTDITITETPATATALSVLPSVIGDANEIVSSATASALQTEPTIAVETGDHVEITTSIPVSAEFPPATVSTQTFINITVGPATAYSELVNNVIVGSSNTVAFSAEEFVASAELVKPFLSESPMFASAQSGNHTVYVDPNYGNLVRSKNPYLYFYDGQTSSVNGGYQNGTFTRGDEVTSNVTSISPMNLVGNQKSWRLQGSLNGDHTLSFTAPTTAESFNNIIRTSNFTVEFWFRPENEIGYSQNYFINSWFASQFLTFGPYSASISNKNGFRLTAPGITLSGAYNSTSANIWNHIVIRAYITSGTTRVFEVWKNGSILMSGSTSTVSSTTVTNQSLVLGGESYSFENNGIAPGQMDEWAIYNFALSNSEIVQHYEFISTLSPNSTIFPDIFEANSESGNHQFTVTSNAIPEIKEATASALLTMPTLIAGRSFTHNANPMTASATVFTPEVSLGTTFLATPNIAYAESVNAYHLNSVYSDYVQANITPYRYVTFDGANAFVDYGTDADYSVIPTSVGGTIVNPDEGINGKSAKTAGSSYITDGVILKESEWNDAWGTGQSSYHSSFWMEEAPEDNSTGLRVLWNLNGYKDNQHAILYNYQSKLHMQFNNGSGTHLDFATTNNINLFDGLRHFVVVAFDHTNNNNNQVLLYVDSVLVLTCSLGSYTGQTVNGTTFVGPNDEANNHPRLGVGCLITPFGVTALPVVPTNTRLYIDEIVWAKTAINQTGVTALYNAMPDKDNSEYVSDLLEASAEIVAPVLSTSTLFVASPGLASGLIMNPNITADRNLVIFVDQMTANAEFVPALRLDNIIFNSDVMVASAIFNNAGAIITIPGGPMLANFKMIHPSGTHNGSLKQYSSYVRYLRVNSMNNSMYSMKEIK
jgi:hypothetical protein